MWHVWVKSFRKKNNLTQDAAAEMLCVDVRTIRRWEAGAYPSGSHVKRFEHILMPAADHRLAANIKPLLQVTGDLMIAFDIHGRVLGQSIAHKAHMHSLWGDGGDVTGVMWFESKYVPENLKIGWHAVGRFEGRLKDGWVSLRTPFITERDGQIVNAGHADSTILRLADGPVILSVTRKNLDPVFIEQYVRPHVVSGVIAPDHYTTLDS